MHLSNKEKEAIINFLEWLLTETEDRCVIIENISDGYDRMSWQGTTKDLLDKYILEADKDLKDKKTKSWNKRCEDHRRLLEGFGKKR